MPRQMPTTPRPRILALKPAEEASSSRSKSAAVVPDVNTPSRTVRPPFRLFDPFSAGLNQFQPTAFMSPVRTSVATEFNSGEQKYDTINSSSCDNTICKILYCVTPTVSQGTLLKLSDYFQNNTFVTINKFTAYNQNCDWSSSI